ncbi:MAG: YgiQ family radical SAM protein [Prevotellaceae bacterium]|jgi:uncharacterized radical SAM protein YgiQ|nr:YgiQ family radical SAM protein [Prevotellaceae bacterium]
MMSDLTIFLPTTKKELEIRGWNEVDVVLFSGDAYIDHPSFGAAVIGRVIENQGLRVAIVPQPNWRDDLRDFKKMGVPRLFFAISAGCMDSKVNHYTANRRLRSNDAYSPDNQAGFRPDNATIVYSNILKRLYPNTPVIIGGIEASLRRFSHYDYWNDRLEKSILIDSKADILVYGMGEKPIIDIINALKNGKKIEDLRDIPQIAYAVSTLPALFQPCHCGLDPQSPEKKEIPTFTGITEVIELFSYEQCLKNKKKSAQNFRIIEEQSNSFSAKILVQKTDNQYVIVNPPNVVMTSAELDKIHALPFTRLPHPKYKGKRIPAYEMIKFSINTHRGCFGGCSFCTISAHQGKFIVSRSEKSILEEVKKVSQLPDFKGYISDLGGPSANMYRLAGKNFELCKKCRRPSCIFPKICNNLNISHKPLLELYKKVDSLPQIKKSFIGSGVRYDILLHRTDDKMQNADLEQYTEELIKNHVSGRLKIAPEHTSKKVLDLVRKPNFSLFKDFKEIFDKINTKHSLNQQLIPYFISSLPECSPENMAELAAEVKHLNFRLEQVQDFTPTPMTLATEMFYTGLNPYTLEKIFIAKNPKEKTEQKIFFFAYKKEYKQQIYNILTKLKRFDLIQKFKNSI